MSLPGGAISYYPTLSYGNGPRAYVPALQRVYTIPLNTPIELEKRGFFQRLMHGKYQPVPLPQATLLLAQTLQQLATANSLKAPQKVEITNNPTYNAFATPKDVISFNAGLLKEANSPEELAFIAAHELAHVNTGDAKQQRVIQTTLAVTGALLPWLFPSNWKYFAGQLAGYAALSNFVALFSRKKETRADLKAIQYLCNAGINPTGYLQALMHMDLQEQKMGTVKKLLVFLFGRTHPSINQRKSKLEKTFSLPVTGYLYSPVLNTQQWQVLKQSAFRIKMEEKEY